MKFGIENQTLTEIENIDTETFVFVLALDIRFIKYILMCFSIPSNLDYSHIFNVS